MTLPDDKYLIAALEAHYSDGHSISNLKENPRYYPGPIAHARALERIAELEAKVDRFPMWLNEVSRQRDEALAKLAQYEPRVDADLALAREVAAGWRRRSRYPDTARPILLGECDNFSDVQCALAGIKAVRAGGGL